MHKEQLVGDSVFLIHEFLTVPECAQLITRTEETGYDEAPITTSVGFVMRKDVRNNDRLMLDEPEFAAQLWEKARPLVPAEWLYWVAVGLNERFRYYRYAPGQRFVAHTDGYYERPNGERSHLTFMVYLNEDFDGGTTNFLKVGKQPLRVVPRTGLALVFAHKLLHEGAEVTRGQKYVLRTDVMYRRP
jgi:predicted 2-oxoglutarate/Fe(II)-dependent dioxygenase YbiX